MNLIRKIMLVMTTVLAFVSADAKIATWSIAPKYQELSRYHGDLFVFQENGKWGLIRPGNDIILPASYDYITPFVNGYALAGTNVGSEYLLEAIIGENGKITRLNSSLYLPKSYIYVSEGKLAVRDKSGKYGYVDTSGRIIIACQFDNAFPFKEGWAPVKQGNYMKFINEQYNRNSSRGVLRVDFHYGEMTVAGCFSNGRAPIAYNKDYAIIGLNGQIIRKLKEIEFQSTFKTNNSAPDEASVGFSSSNNYSAFVENGKRGLKNSEGIVLHPQFDSFGDQYADGFVIATVNGKHGLLKISEGSVGLDIMVDGRKSNTLDVDRKGNITSINVECTLPTAINRLKFLIDEGNGQYVDRTSAFNREGRTAMFSFSPTIVRDAETCEIKIIAETDGIILASQQKQFVISYPVKLRISAPGPSECNANSDGIATVSSTVFNDSNKDVTVRAKWSNGSETTITVKAHGSKSILTTYHNVTSKHEKYVGVTLSSGESNGRTITFIPFF